MKHKKHDDFIWQLGLAVGLIVLSAVLYLEHYAIFHDAHHIFLYLLGDIAFLPLEVLLVTLVLHRIIELREKHARLKKMNMIVGAFFNEVGTQLLQHLLKGNDQAQVLRQELIINSSWKPKNFVQAQAYFKNLQYSIEIVRMDLTGLRDFLILKRQFLLRLLENDSVLEHETFTDLLWAVFHLTEELSHRSGFLNLPVNDIEHLARDIKRAYAVLVYEWIGHMRHLQEEYPYLFSLAIRTNPFDEQASVIIK